MSETKLNRRDFYPLADFHKGNMNLPSLGYSSNNIMAQWTGERRPPKKGEWYLSGALIEAYMARKDLNIVFPIAKLYKVTRKSVEIITPIEEVE